MSPRGKKGRVCRLSWMKDRQTGEDMSESAIALVLLSLDGCDHTALPRFLTVWERGQTDSDRLI